MTSSTKYNLCISVTNSPVKTEMVEFQALILATGNDKVRMYPLTEEIPPCLLKVDNQPILWYQLALLSQSMFTEVIVATSEKDYAIVYQYICEEYTGKVKVEVLAVDASLDDGDILRQLQDKLVAQYFVILPGDLILDMKLEEIADLHRNQDSTITMLFKEVRKYVNTGMKHGKQIKRDADMVDSVGLQRQKDGYQRVVAYLPKACAEEEVYISKKLFRKLNTQEGESSMVLRNDFMETSVYIMSNWVLDVLNEKKHLSDIRLDIIPYFVQKQYQTVSTAMFSNHLVNRLWGELLMKTPSIEVMIERIDLNGAEKESSMEFFDVIKCFAYILKPDAGYCQRADLKDAYHIMERQVQAKRFQGLMD